MYLVSFYVHAFCLHSCPWNTYIPSDPGGLKRRSGLLELQLLESSCGSWESDSGLLQEKQVLLTSEPPLRPPIYFSALSFYCSARPSQRRICFRVMSSLQKCPPGFDRNTEKRMCLLIRGWTSQLAEKMGI